MAASRFVCVSHSPWLGGAERCLLELVREVARRPAPRVHVLLPGEGPLRPALDAAGAGTSVVPARWWASGPGERTARLDVHGALATARALARLRPDVVLSNTMVHPAGALAAALVRVPHLWWLHELGERDHGFRFRLGLDRTLRAVGRRARVVGGRRARRRAVDRPDPPRPARRRRARRRAAARAGAVAAPARDRRPRPAVEGPAGRRAGARAPPRRGARRGRRWDAGGRRGAAGARRGARGRAARAADRRPAGPVGAFDDADLVLMCSREEAFGRVAVEAMKRGRCVVAAASGGALEIVEDGATGRLYRPGDPADVARVCAGLLDDDARRATLAEAGRLRALERYSAARQADAVLAAADEAVR